MRLFRVEKEVTKQDGTTGDTKSVLHPRDVLGILQRIPEENLVDMGLSMTFARPEWMIIRVLPVPPPQVRPSIQMDGSSRGEDDLTHKLSDILKANANVAKHERDGSPPSVVNDFEVLLQVCRMHD